MSRNRGLTLVEVLVIACALAVLVAIMLPMLGTSSRRHKPTENITSTQVRGTVQALVLYAQGNNGYYPGLDAHGQPVDLSVEHRFRLLLEGDFVTPDFAISPLEKKGKTPWTGGAVTSANYSYALPSLADDGARRREWRETSNHEALAVTDRGIPDGHGSYSSIHTRGKPFRGSVGWNDGHVTWEGSHILTETVHGDVRTTNDDLFTAAGPDDAWMIHSGE